MARQLSFFYRRGQLSGEIRRQMARRIGAKVNPFDDTSEDICIGIKMSPYAVGRDKHVFKWHRFYLDLIDHSTVLKWLKKRPWVDLIVASRSAEFYVPQLLPNPITFIPQHHCNFERTVKKIREPRVVAYVGTTPPLADWVDTVASAISKMNLELRVYGNCARRGHVVNAYLETDIQFTWRNDVTERLLYTKNPLKILNAASFGIPTVANIEPAFEYECRDHYFGVRALSEALDAIRELQTNPACYERFAAVGPTLAEPYHVDHIGAAFQRLAYE